MEVVVELVEVEIEVGPIQLEPVRTSQGCLPQAADDERAEELASVLTEQPLGQGHQKDAVVIDDPLEINRRCALAEDVAQCRAEQEATELVQDRTHHLQLLPLSHLLLLRPKELEALRVVPLRGKLRTCRRLQ